MIAVQCQCGKTLTVEDRYAGRLARCPHCSQQLRIPRPVAAVKLDPPASPSVRMEVGLPPKAEEMSTYGVEQLQAFPDLEKAPQHVAPGATTTLPQVAVRPPQLPTARKRQLQISSLPEIVTGALMLFTVIIPWGATDGKTIMSWDALRGSPGIIVATVILCWCVGLANVVVGITVRQLPRSIIAASTGLLAILLMLSMTVTASDSIPGSAIEARMNAGGTLLLSSIGLLFFLTHVVTTTVRLRIGEGLTGRIFQGISGGGLAVLAIIGLITIIVQFSDTPRFIRERIIFDFVLWIIFLVLPIAAGVLGLLQASGAGRRNLMLSMLSLVLALGSAVLLPAYWIAKSSSSEIGLAVICVSVLFIGPFVLLCRGLSGAIALLTTGSKE